ncbi:MAG: MurR/RpiR family transcriptional regulator [Coriobacteriaceae bacterium]|uniref:MurR/RpiR family transcriptional regulator n=1 Tax=Tractidigestivibacter sp. TaxID=2847320 RepID=UPI002A91BA2C|nr:MurR/RpiR family transcriptional regulator [Tractidigestivibacter sp.]MCI6273516.1 MurR/RpiR family transcriptional regulator [Coriobacteriaceae bacterium]MCI6843663.1 MurR/RpiR family transcriptional regulator [Coriobacteriaceae bacterium]MCI7437988.1 MurR/RpiR family transcriptional regulator [Coriobacteriaceae bacterium]MDD7583527.1 MurR/RpiR family transcriptional regulator [Coriobacteriaceae bacterium]MDY5270923.1 MurR/RpiR family transcriptional regulator [Tractidigestivibacter sp.]
MDAFEQMRLHAEDLTPTERKVLDAVMDNPEGILQSTTTMAAQHIGVSQSAVSRFCQKVGYENFGDFRMNLLLSLSSSTPTSGPRESQEAIDYLCDMMRATSGALDKDVVANLTERILSSKAVYTAGAGLSSPPALMLSMELLKYEIPCYCMPSGQEMIYMHVASPDDLIVIFSSKNDTQRVLLNVIQEMSAQRRPHTVMISHTAAHPLRKAADEFILLPTWQTERYPVYIEPMTSMLAFCSILMVEVSRRTGSDPEMLPSIVNGRRRRTQRG